MPDARRNKGPVGASVLDRVGAVPGGIGRQVAASETQDAVPLLKGAGTMDRFQEWIRSRSAEKKDTVTERRVSFLALLSFSTTGEKWLMALGLAISVVSGLCVPTWLILLAKSLDEFSNLARLINSGLPLMELVQQELNRLVIAFAVLGVISLITGSMYVSIWTYTGERQALRIKERFVHSALRQDAEYFDAKNRDEVPTVVANAMVHVSGAVGRQMADLFANLWSSAGCLAVALVLNAPLALIMLCIVPVVGVVIAILSCFVRRSSRRSGERFASAGALATEVISGIKTVASLRAEGWALRRYEGSVREAQRDSVWGGFLSSLSSGTMGFLFYCTYTVAFAVGTRQVADNSGVAHFIKCFVGIQDGDDCNISGATVMCCIYGVILCATFFGLMAPGLNAVNLGRQAAVHIFSTIKRVPSIDPKAKGGTVLKSLEGRLEMRNVFFAYPTRLENPIFTNFNLVIEPGSSVALVGPSGSGKSTIARLLLRFYDPTAGELTVDGIPLRDLNLSWWRSRVGYVSQEPTMFPGTVRYNIACGRDTATDDDVLAASRAARCHEFISALPYGYDTYYTGSSIQLSGGQMQRICIARAVIRRPAVLLLDEATSALDTNSERQVQEALANVRRTGGVTTVTVAHRLSTIVGCDKIAVISGGGIAEAGTHRTLLEAGGIYATLCESQGITLRSALDGMDEVPNADTAETAEAVDTAVGSGAVETSLPTPAPPPGGSVGGGRKATDAEGGFDEEAAKGGDEDDDDDDGPEREELAKSSRLWGMNRPEWGYVLMGGVGSCMVGALPPCEGILTARIVANFYEVEPEDMMEANAPYILGFMALAGGCLVGNVMAGCGFSVSGYRLTRRMRVMAFGSVVRRGMGWFDVPEHSTGELTTRLEADSEAVAKVTGWSLGYRIRVFATLAAGVVIALYFAWPVGVVAIFCVPLIMGAAIIQRVCMSRRFVTKYDGLSPGNILEQGLRGINAVQAYGLQDKVCDDYSSALLPECEGKVRLGAVAGFVFGFSQFAVFCSFAVLFYVGSQLLVRGEVDFAQFFTSILAVMFGALGIAQVNADFNAQQDGLAAAARIFRIVDEPLDEFDPLSKEGTKPKGVHGSIAFKSVGFHYPTRPGHPVYYPSKGRDGLDLSISPRESVAFVGRSGCGKSTALQLLMRFYRASSGTVALDGTDVRDIRMSWLRGQMGYVGQQPVLFAGTVRENILLGNQRATEEEIVAAAKAANAHGFITELGGGYDAEIGAGGSLLSGGQRQRIAIARAIVSDPRVLVLDEATSALDNESERVVQAALDGLQAREPRTTLVVAHRLVTVRNCDRIAVLDGGGVRELGSHEQLLELGGLYHELWTKQVGGSK